MKSKFIFFVILIVLLSLAPITVFSVTPLSTITTQSLLVNTIQRLIGLWAFTLLFIQIILGSYMTRWIEKFGGWIFKFHILEGLTVYFLIILHPLLFIVFRYLIGQGFDPFYVFVDVCLICKKSLEFSYNFGRIGFWLLTIGVIAAYFRTSTPFLRIHWHKFHVLNYVAFFSIWFHSLKLGSDIGTAPFSFFHGPSLMIVLIIATVKLLKFVRSLARYWKLQD